MPDDLKLSLDREKDGKRGGGPLLVVLVAVAVALGAANLALLAGGGGTGGRGEELPPEDLEVLALKLEKLNLHSAAADVWTDYLDAASPGRGERARIWYRIGTVRQEGGDCEGALAAFYRSEAEAKIPGIESEISIRIEECLAELGEFAAMRAELESRTAVPGAGGDNGGETLAEIGGWKITRADVEEMIETEIEAQLIQAAGGMPPGEVRRRKEKLLDEVLAQGRLAGWLERFVAEEILYRHATESGLHEDPEVRRYSRNMERKLLAQTALDREYAGSVEVTEEMMRSWYEGHIEALKDEDGEVPPFEEARERVWAAVRREQEMKAQSALLEELRERYDVVIHGSALGGGEGPEEGM